MCRGIGVTTESPQALATLRGSQHPTAALAAMGFGRVRDAIFPAWGLVTHIAASVRNNHPGIRFRLHQMQIFRAGDRRCHPSLPIHQPEQGRHKHYYSRPQMCFNSFPNADSNCLRLTFGALGKFSALDNALASRCQQYPAQARLYLAMGRGGQARYHLIVLWSPFVVE